METVEIKHIDTMIISKLFIKNNRIYGVLSDDSVEQDFDFTDSFISFINFKGAKIDQKSFDVNTINNLINNQKFGGAFIDKYNKASPESGVREGIRNFSKKDISEENNDQKMEFDNNNDEELARILHQQELNDQQIAYELQKEEYRKFGISPNTNESNGMYIKDFIKMAEEEFPSLLLKLYTVKLKRETIEYSNINNKVINTEVKYTGVSIGGESHLITENIIFEYDEENENILYSDEKNNIYISKIGSEIIFKNTEIDFKRDRVDGNITIEYKECLKQSNISYSKKQDGFISYANFKDNIVYTKNSNDKRTLVSNGMLFENDFISQLFGIHSDKKSEKDPINTIDVSNAKFNENNEIISGTIKVRKDDGSIVNCNLDINLETQYPNKKFKFSGRENEISK